MAKPNKPLLSEEFLNEIAFEMAQIYGNPDGGQVNSHDQATINEKENKSEKLPE
jgi:hypothetical protein